MATARHLRPEVESDLPPKADKTYDDRIHRQDARQASDGAEWTAARKLITVGTVAGSPPFDRSASNSKDFNFKIIKQSLLTGFGRFCCSCGIAIAKG